MKKQAAFILLLVLQLAALPARADKITVPEGFTEAIRVEVDNKTGAILSVKDIESPVFGATVIIPPGALATPEEEFVLSYSSKLPGPTRPPTDEFKVVQNSYTYTLQVQSGEFKQMVQLMLPIFNEENPTLFYGWEKDVMEYHPTPPGRSMAMTWGLATYPRVYVSLTHVGASHFVAAKEPAAKAPEGWEHVPNADMCLKEVSMVKNVEFGARVVLYDYTFTNRCDYPIQASGCKLASSRGCDSLPEPVILPPKSDKTLAVRGTQTINVGACRVSLEDGRAVKYNLDISKAAGTDTYCMAAAGKAR